MVKMVPCSVWCCQEGVSWCQKVSYCVRKVSEGVMKVSDGVRNVFVMFNRPGVAEAVL